MAKKAAQLSNIWMKHFNPILGKKVVGIVHDPSGGDNLFPQLGLRFEDDTIAWILRDDEGNGPGWLEIVEPKTKKAKVQHGG